MTGESGEPPSADSGDATESRASGAPETPAAIVDLDRVRENARRAASYCEAHGLHWRPHIKTHKSLAIGEIQLRAGARGFTVATPREAEVMSRICDDLVLAYPPVGGEKLHRLVSLPPEVRLSVALDSEVVLAGLAEAFRVEGREAGVLVEADVGMGRVGVQSPADAVALARRAETLDGVRYRGLLFYPGHIRHPISAQDEPLEALSATLSTFIEALDGSGLSPETVSGGSTPTLFRSHEIPGLTEVRAGTCIFHDRDSVALGAGEWDDVAYTVLATVVSTAVPGQAVVDAGSKALSKETFRAGGGGFGALLDRPEVTVSSLSEEHGILDLSGTPWRPRIGERVRIVPNHVCVSVNLQERLHAVEEEGPGGGWEIEARGRSSFDFRSP